MFSKMMQLVNRTDSLPLTPPQQKEILDYSKSLSARFEAARRVESAEKTVIETAVRHIQDAVPELGDFEDAGWSSHGDDLTFALRTIVQGMLLDDDDYAKAVSLDSLSRELGYLDVPQTAVNEIVIGFQKACEEHLPPSASQTLAPYFESATSVAA